MSELVAQSHKLSSRSAVVVQVVGVTNIRAATLFPRHRNRLVP